MKYAELFKEGNRHLTLNDVVTKLGTVEYKTKNVYFVNLTDDWEGTQYTSKPVNSFHSYIYDGEEPSCSTNGTEVFSVIKLIEVICQFIGSVQPSYRGGEFIMQGYKPLWTVRWGCGGEMGVVDIVECEEGVFFVVDHCEDQGE